MDIKQFENDLSKSIKVGDYVRVYIDKFNITLRQNFKVKCNWSCRGSVSIEETEQFILELQEAVKLAKEEVKYKSL